jgi:amino acid adenylation domain-containing protein
MATLESTRGCDGIDRVREAAPQSIALRFGNLALTYQDLNRQADQFAAYFEHLGVLPGDAVALCMPRSFEWIIAALAIMRAGAAYVPLDPDWPEARICYALENSNATLLVAPAAMQEALALRVPGVDTIRDSAAIAAMSGWPTRTIRPDSLAYVIYTSGSTGVPKGVEITHANLSHLIRWHHGAFKVTSRDRASHMASLGFDAAIWEIWPHLAAGATLCLADDAVRSSAEMIQSWMLSEGITIGFVPTVHAIDMMTLPWPTTTKLRFLLTGGDTLHRGPETPLPFQVVNNYGPTECTVVTTSSVLSPEAAGVPLIGRPITGTYVYLLDEHGKEVPDGTMGEIFVGGNGVGNGYRNLPDLTLKSFLPDPFAGLDGARMYRTGDRGMRSPDGQIEFCGRADRQVKIRGHRIELDEISAVLSQHPRVGFATAAVEESKLGEPRLVAYVLPNRNARAPATQDLQKHLLRTLPHYMVPGIFVQLAAVPVSSSGKIDLTLLPKSTDAKLLNRDAVVEFANSTEEKLVDLVQALLQIDEIGVEDNFFLAGGHSLLGMQLILRLRSTFGVDLTLRQLFEAPTIKSLGALIDIKLLQNRLSEIWRDIFDLESVQPETRLGELRADESLIAPLRRRILQEFDLDIATLMPMDDQTISLQAELIMSRRKDDLALPPGVVAMQPRGSRNSIFWLHYPCPNLALAMADEHPFFYVTVTEEDLKTLGGQPTLPQIASCLVPRIVASQTEGPYVLGGFCLGGILSYEVASQMQAAGHEVALLVLVDTPRPEHCWPARSVELIARPRYLMRRLAQLGLRESLVNLWTRVVGRISGKGSRTDFPPQGESFQAVIEFAASRYRPSKYKGKVTLIMASDPTPEHPPLDHFLPLWRALLPPDQDSRFVKGQHLDLVEGHAVNVVADIIRSNIAASSRG